MRSTLTASPLLRPRALASALIALSLLGAGSSSQAADGSEPGGSAPISVHVQRRDDLIVVDVQARVAAASSLVFAVLTDYAHMPSFLSAIKTSAVLSDHDGVTRVEQTGEARHGFLRFGFHTVRDIQSTGTSELRSHLVEGDFKTYDMVTRLSERDGVTTIEQHGEYIPNAWIPPGIGPSAIEDETAKGYGEVLAEVVKRRDLAAPPVKTSAAGLATP